MEKTINEIKGKLLRIELGLMVADRKTVVSDIRKIHSLCRGLLRDVNRHFNTTAHMTGVGKVLKQGE